MVKTAILSIFVICELTYGHGENKPGPHGGSIRMPGAFHTELLPEGNSTFKLYLLDINWKNPTVQNSKLDIKISQGSKSGGVSCKESTDHYFCSVPKGFSLKKGRLIVNSTRDNSPGAEVIYNLPFGH